MYFEPGVRGRKTGLTVADSGVRDEHGLEPMDNLFSSPEKPQAPPPPPAPIQAKLAAPNLMPPPAKPARVEEKRAPVKSAKKPASKPVQAAAPVPAQPPQPQQNGNRKPADETIDDSQSMSLNQSTIPEPTAVLSERRKSQYIPPPKSTSPKKTFLGSPARRHPSLGPPTNPTSGDIIREAEKLVREKVARKLDFSNDSTRMSPPKQVERRRSNASRSPAPAATNGKRKRGSQEVEVEVEDPIVDKHIPHEQETERSRERSMPGSWEPEPEPEQEAEKQAANRSFDFSPSNVEDEEWRPSNVNDEMDIDEEIERTATPPEPSPPREPAAKERRASLEKAVVKAKPSKPTQEESQAEKRKPGRPKKQTIPMAQAEVYQKEIEASLELAEDDTDVAPALPPPKRLKNSKSALGPGNKNRRLAPEPARDSSPVQIQRGPPRPRQNGLFILRRETPALNGFATTRSGRASVKPVAYWENETVVYDEDGDAGDASLLLPTVNEVIRRDEVNLDEPRPKQRGRKAKRDVFEDEDDEAEPWEQEPGRIYGAVKAWDSGKEASALDVPEREDEIALSGPAIITRAIPGSDVQFAKTLTLPFFGSGMVDLPPGAVKKPKNSRKMQMVFFVFKGRVKVSVNGTEFRTGEGGVWQVPRGNFYSIENDYEKPARVFFSQGCEMPAAAAPMEE